MHLNLLNRFSGGQVESAALFHALLPASQSAWFPFLFVWLSEYSVSEQDSFFFFLTRFEIIILDMKDLLDSALIWNTF